MTRARGPFTSRSKANGGAYPPGRASLSFMVERRGRTRSDSSVVVAGIRGMRDPMGFSAATGRRTGASGPRGLRALDTVMKRATAGIKSGLHHLFTGDSACANTRGSMLSRSPSHVQDRGSHAVGVQPRVAGFSRRA